ncbi:alkylglycerol monooxygenase-like [Styela clava]
MEVDGPHTNSSELTFLEGFRATFYVVTPSETYFEKMSEVPNYITAAIPHFFILISLEMMILYQKGNELRINDKITSIGAGMYSQVLELAGLKSIEFTLYVYIYNHYRVYEMEWNSIWTWIFMALAYDCLYYWFHRLAHEVNILWNTHQTHHSSEDYVLTTALRQSAFQTYASFSFYLPAALLIPPSSFMVHRQLNLLYQFWIHTELVDSLGPLEYILNTPSHHRVHHGRNPYCIDKNYAAVLIIWDRMFGTFQPEKKDEKVVYGLVHPIDTFDSNAIQVSHYMSFWKRLQQHETIGNKLRFIFCGPGWSPGTPRLGNPEDLPKIVYPVKVYNPDVSDWLSAYTMLHFLVAVSIFSQATFLHSSLPTSAIISSSIFILSSLTCFGYLFDKRPFALFTELSRCVLSSSFMIMYFFDVSKNMRIPEIILAAVIGLFLLSAVMWIVRMLSSADSKRKSL